MKDLSDTYIMLIRQCKKNKTSIRSMRKIISKGYALPLSYVDLSHVVYHLTQIVTDYDLVWDWSEFLLVDLNPKKWWTKEQKSYNDNLLEQLIYW